MSNFENYSNEQKLEMFNFYKSQLVKTAQETSDILNEHFLNGTKDEDLHRRYEKYISNLFHLRSIRDELLGMKYRYVGTFYDHDGRIRSYFMECSMAICSYYDPLFEYSVIELRAKFQEYCLAKLDPSIHKGLWNFKPKLIELHEF